MFCNFQVRRARKAVMLTKRRRKTLQRTTTVQRAETIVAVAQPVEVHQRRGTQMQVPLMLLGFDGSSASLFRDPLLRHLRYQP